MDSLRELVTGSGYAIAYSGGMVAFCTLYLAYIEWVFWRERRVGDDLAKLIAIAAYNPEAQVKLNRYVNVRDVTHPACREDPQAGAMHRESDASAMRRTVGACLAAVAGTPWQALGAAGLRPSAPWLLDTLVRFFPRPGKLKALVTLIGLLGTFLGIVLALTIMAEGFASVDPKALSDTLRKLLAMTAAKFWISVAALVLALLVHLYDAILERRLEALCRRLGALLDNALAKEEVGRAWCAPVDAGTAAFIEHLVALKTELAASVRHGADERAQMLTAIAEVLDRFKENLSLGVALDVDSKVLQIIADQLSDAVFGLHAGQAPSAAQQVSAVLVPQFDRLLDALAQQAAEREAAEKARHEELKLLLARTPAPPREKQSDRPATAPRATRRR